MGSTFGFLFLPTRVREMLGTKTSRPPSHNLRGKKIAAQVEGIVGKCHLVVQTDPNLYMERGQLKIPSWQD